MQEEAARSVATRPVTTKSGAEGANSAWAEPAKRAQQTARGRSPRRKHSKQRVGGARAENTANSAWAESVQTNRERFHLRDR